MPLKLKEYEDQVDKPTESRKLLKSLFEQKMDGTLCDVQLCLQGSIIWGHACVLASCSSYFSEYFRPSNIGEPSWENHWCSKKPLIIDLGRVMSDTVDMCLICVSKIIDFMYLRELVVIRGHFQHFSKIAYFLEVSDLLPLCSKYFDKRNGSAPLSSLPSLEQVSESSSKIGSVDNVTKLDNACSSKTPSNQLNAIILENQPETSLASELHGKPIYASDEVLARNNSERREVNPPNKITEHCTNESTGFTTENMGFTTQLPMSSSYHGCTNEVKNTEHFNSERKEDKTINQKCEFLCCNTDTDSLLSCGAKQRKRRKMACELCTHSSVSVKKILKHVENSNHFGTACPICNRQTKGINDLKEHLKDHDDSKPYICHICKKRNRHWEYHKLHLRVHCKNRQFHCEVCQKSFKQRQNLTTHLMTHEKNYFCGKCDYLTSDKILFKAHLLQHSDEIPINDPLDINSGENKSLLNNQLEKYEKDKKCYCQVCGESFTQKKNLVRHIKIKHFNNLTNYSCSVCTYTTKRTDLLRHHMKKHHNSLPSEAEEKEWKEKRKLSKYSCSVCTTKRTDLLRHYVKERHNCLPSEAEENEGEGKRKLCKKQQLEEVIQSPDNIVGVLIPVQLLSTNGASALSAFAVKTCRNLPLENEENIQSGISKRDQNQSNASAIRIQTELFKPLQPSHTDHVSPDRSKIINSFINTAHILENAQNITQSKTDLCDEEINSLHSGSNSNKDCLTVVVPDRQRTISENNINKLLITVSADTSFENSADVTEPVNVYTSTEEENGVNLMGKENKGGTDGIECGCKILESEKDIWLNEATGELLSGEKFVNVHIIDTGCRRDHSQHMSTATAKSSLDFGDPYQTLILNETTGELSIFDLGDDTDELQSNPQTPQANLVEFDDPDNLLSWNCLDAWNSFYSTWVLNEATGELNMVSFSIQHLKDSDESKLTENTGTFTAVDDDDTALFLNEGTGDLSVIYFNPNKSECNSPKNLLNDQLSQETMSEHSNDDDDVLNENFLMASASFMAHEGNETFLNELTGEFDIADLNEYQPETQESQVTGNESIYLNEETGEISWNVLDQNVKSDLFTNADGLRYDFDDSLNCEDFEPFSTEMNDFSSQFCLDTNTSNDWHVVDGSCDILLNECTGELVKRN